MEPEVELEAKLAASPAFELPVLDGAVDGLVARAGDTVAMDVTYLDAADLRLTRAGVSLRHRTGEGGPDGAWTLKEQPETDGIVLRRSETVVAGAPGAVPDVLLGRIRARLRTAPMIPVAHLRTVRRRTSLIVDGTIAGELDDDDVSVMVDESVVERFRELEVESGDIEVIAAVVERLRAAGAGEPDPTSKLVRALGPRASAAADVVVPPLGAGSSVAELVGAAVAAPARRLIDLDARVRDDDDPESVHLARVACRRLRSNLRTLGPVLEAGWAEPIAEELRWLAGVLGEVRDRDVLGLDIEAELGDTPVLHRLRAERDRAMATLLDTLDGPRYLTLLDRLVEAASAPAVPAVEGERPAAEALPALVGRPWRRLRRAVRDAGRDPSDEELHAIRIRAKRARYAAELAVPVVGKEAARFARALGGLQDVLGRLNDGAVAEAWVREALPSATPAEAFDLGRLVERRRRSLGKVRRQWRAAWDDVDRPKLTNWV